MKNYLCSLTLIVFIITIYLLPANFIFAFDAEILLSSFVPSAFYSPIGISQNNN